MEKTGNQVNNPGVSGEEKIDNPEKVKTFPD